MRLSLLSWEQKFILVPAEGLTLGYFYAYSFSNLIFQKSMFKTNKEKWNRLLQHTIKIWTCDLWLQDKNRTSLWENVSLLVFHYQWTKLTKTRIKGNPNLTYSYTLTSIKISIDLEGIIAKEVSYSCWNKCHKCLGLKQHRFTVFLLYISETHNESHCSKIKVSERPRSYSEALWENKILFLSSF